MLKNWHLLLNKLTGIVLVYLFLAFHSTTALGQTKHTISKTVPEIVRHLKPVGALPGNEQLTLALVLPLRNQDSLRHLLQDLYDPASIRFRHYLSPAQFTDRFGPTAKDYQKLEEFVKAQGLAVMTAHPNRTILNVKGSVSVIDRVFHTRIMVYRRPREINPVPSKEKISRTTTFYSTNTEPSYSLNLPILSIRGLDDYVRMVNGAEIHPITATAPPLPIGGSGLAGTFISKDLRAAYAPGVTLTGAGQVVGIYNPPHLFKMEDIIAFEDKTGLPHVPVSTVLTDAIPAVFSPFSGEVTLDVEMAISMAPGLEQVIVYQGNDFTTTMNKMATDNTAKQLSVSWSPIPVDAAADNVYKEFAIQGQSFFCSSGDAGAFYPPTTAPANDGNPNWAVDSLVTVVGGTVLKTTGPAGAWASDTVWKGSGGGWYQGDQGSAIANYIPMPSWQKGVGMFGNNGSLIYRNSPDVAISATNLYHYFDGDDNFMGGTSASTPLWAGFAALANEKAQKMGRPSIGFLNPAIYAIGRSGTYTSQFHDVTKGNNKTKNNSLVSDSARMYFARPGFDLCTGWGTPAGINLINALIDRKPVTLDASLNYIKPNGDECDPGPVAGGVSSFDIVPKDGVPPYTYQWSAGTASFVIQPTSTTTKVQVNIPALGLSAILSVTVTDSGGNMITRIFNLTGLDRAIAGREDALCKLFQEMAHRFRPPLYINPGDPGPLGINSRTYSPVYLRNMQRAINRLSRQITALQNLKH